MSGRYQDFMDAENASNDPTEVYALEYQRFCSVGSVGIRGATFNYRSLYMTQVRCPESVVFDNSVEEGTNLATGYSTEQIGYQQMQSQGYYQAASLHSTPMYRNLQTPAVHQTQTIDPALLSYQSLLIPAYHEMPQSNLNPLIQQAPGVVDFQVTNTPIRRAPQGCGIAPRL